MSLQTVLFEGWCKKLLPLRASATPSENPEPGRLYSIFRILVITGDGFPNKRQRSSK